MKFRRIAVLCAVSLFLSGCGVPQEKFEAVLTEREGLEEHAASIQGDLEEAQAKIAKLQDELSPLKTRFTNLQSQLDAASSRAATLKREVSDLKRIKILKTDYCAVKPDTTTGNHTAKAENIFTFGETVWYYVEFNGTKYSLFDGKWFIHLVVNIDVFDPEGKSFDNYVFTEHREVKRPYSHMFYIREYSGMTAGEYSVEITVEDKLSGEITTDKSTFQVIS